MITENYAQWIFQTHADKCDKLAIVDQYQSLTYSQLKNKVDQTSGFLCELNLKPQQRIVICLEDCVEWAIAFMSALATGLNPVLISSDLPTKEIKRIIELCEADAIVTNLDVDFGIQKITQHEINACVCEPVVEYYKWHPDEFCFWLMSSGTSGESKCVVHRHQDLINLLEIVAGPAYHIDENSRILSTAKLSFTYGFNNSFTFALGKGATSYLINGKPAPSIVFDELRKHAITHFFTVPTVIDSMIRHGKDQTISDSVKIMVSSGEPLPKSVYETFQQQHQIHILDGLGMSEVMYNYCTQTPDNIDAGTIGKPLPGIVCEVRDDAGNLCQVGQIGEMFVKHPCSAFLYWKDWKKTKSTFVGEWVKTNDKVRLRPNGNFEYISRTDDLIKINGQFVSPIEIESALMAHPSIDDCAVVAVKNERGMTKIHACLVVNDTITADDLKTYLRQFLPYYKIPSQFVFANSLPKTVTNKKIRSLLRETVKSLC
jgi:benzoate-CoA ligase